MDRRQLLTSSAAIATAVTASVVASGGVASGAAINPHAANNSNNVARGTPFKLAYGPHSGMFAASAGPDILDQIQFAADQGFTAWEENGLPSREPSVQEKVGALLAKNKMQMGVFVAHGSIGKLTFAKKDPAVWDAVLKDIRNAVEVAKRCGATWMTVVPGDEDQDSRGRLAHGYQTANVIELLRRCCDIIEPNNLVMVLEPLNWFRDHGGVFLRYSDQAYAICKAVNRPSCKILFDIYHQQITEGNLIPNIDRCWDEVAYVQAGDNPGRLEPGTGEINYKNVFKHLAGKGFTGVIGMEHGNSKPGKDGDQAVIDAYRAVDPV
jgi:hydroxypyruvate isomerase